MAQTYLVFDFGSDEERVQQARHKLESWKQAFRLDKKLQYKFERESVEAPAESTSEAETHSAKAEKTKSAKAKSKSAKSKSPASQAGAENHGDVKLFVRLFFSGHEKLSEQRWIDRIPSEDPFKSAKPKVIRENESSFADTVKQFDILE